MSLSQNFLKNKSIFCKFGFHKWKFSYGKSDHYHGSGRFRFCNKCYKRQEESNTLSWSNGDTTWLDVSLKQEQLRDKNLSIVLKED